MAQLRIKQIGRTTTSIFILGRKSLHIPHRGTTQYVLFAGRTFYFGNRQPAYTHLGQGFAHVIQLERLDHSFDFFMLASLMQCMVLNWNLILYRCQGYDTAIIPYLIVSWFAVIHKPAILLPWQCVWFLNNDQIRPECVNFAGSQHNKLWVKRKV